MEGSLKSWLPIILIFRLAFRFITLLDPILGFVIFYNAPLFLHLPRFFLATYPVLMGAFEVYLLWALKKGRFPSGLLFAYFIVATVFEFPYVSIRGGESGLFLFVLLWYIPAPLGLLMLLISRRSGKTP